MFKTLLIRFFPILTFGLVCFLFLAGRPSIPEPLAQKFGQVHPARVEEFLTRAGERLGQGGWLNEVSLPDIDSELPPDLSVVDSGIGIVFAQFAAGRINSERFFETTFFLVNRTSHRTQGTIEFLDDQGNPLVVTIGDVTTSVFEFTLEIDSSRRFQVSGEGEIKVGWAHVHSEQPLGATVTYGIRDAQGNVYTDVGVPESLTGTEFMFFADMVGPSRTGVAVANPGGQQIRIEVRLYDSAGNLIATEEIILTAWGHLARFLDEIFDSVAGITEFEGTVILVSESPFSGITLRSTGEQLTSMPMVKPPVEGLNWTKIAIPHVGNGSLAGLTIKTSVILLNNTGAPATGTIIFANSDGTEMDGALGNGQMASFAAPATASADFQIPPNGSARITTNGMGDLKSGWALISMDRPITGTALFSIFNQAGGLETEAGFAAEALQQRIRVVADSLGNFNTGLAFAHPLSEEFGQTNVFVGLYTRDNQFVASTRVELQPLQHEAKFMTELFPNVPNIAEFDGQLDVVAGEFISIVSLRQAGAKLTSMPNFRESLNIGFAPFSTITFAESLVSTSPAVAWRLQQNEDDFALAQVKIEAPDVQLNDDAFEVGDRIGFGFYAGGASSRVFEMIVRELGSLEFELVSTGTERAFVMGEGILDELPAGGTSLLLTLLDTEPFTYIDSDLVMEFQMIPGLLEAPAGAGVRSVLTELTSVSILPYENLPMTRKTSQMLEFQDPDPALANLVKVLPVYLQPETIAQLEGTQFGANPVVNFTFEIFNSQIFQTTQATVPVAASLNEGGGLSVPVPFVSASDPAAGFVRLKELRVDNGMGPGNAYAGSMAFAPGFRFFLDSLQGGAMTPFSFSFDQPPSTFAIAAFQVGIFGVDADFSGLAVDQVIGTGKLSTSIRTYNAIVESVEVDKVVLKVFEQGFNTPFGRFTLEKFNGSGDGTDQPDLGLTFEMRTPPETPQLVNQRFSMEWDFTGLPITLPATGTTLFAIGIAESTPTLMDLETALRVQHVNSFITE